MKCPTCKREYKIPRDVCLFCGAPTKRSSVESKESLLKKMSLIEFSIFLMVILTFLAAIIYFLFFSEMHRELKLIEVKEYGIIP